MGGITLSLKTSLIVAILLTSIEMVIEDKENESKS